MSAAAHGPRSGIMIVTALTVIFSCSSRAPEASPGMDGSPDTGAAGDDATGATGSEASHPGEDASDASAEGSSGGSEDGDTSDGGRDYCNGATLPAGAACPGRKPTTGAIIGSTYFEKGATITYGVAPDLWDVYPIAGPGQSTPTLTPSADALSISAMLSRPAAGQGWTGIAVIARGSECVDETDFVRGIAFTLSGDLGGCLLYLDAITSQNESSASDPCRGACMSDAGTCIPANVKITESGMVIIPNMSFGEGSPTYAADTSQLIGFRWRLTTSDEAASCTANISLSSVALFGI